MKTPAPKIRIKKAKKRQRSHIPALPRLALEAALMRLEKTDLIPEAKAQLRAMMQAAANPNSERADVVLKTLSRERQENAAETMRVIGALFTGVATRGQQSLDAMNDDEWDRLVGDA